MSWWAAQESHLDHTA